MLPIHEKFEKYSKEQAFAIVDFWKPKVVGRVFFLDNTLYTYTDLKAEQIEATKEDYYVVASSTKDYYIREFRLVIFEDQELKELFDSLNQSALPIQATD